MPTSSAVKVQGLRKTYKLRGGFNFFAPARTLTALEDLNFELPEGSVCALLGPNGAGKTTLLKILSGLVVQDQGQVLVSGQAPGPGALSSLILGQEKSFYWRLTGRQNLDFFATLYGIGRGQAKARIAELTEMLEMESVDRPYQEMSTGHRQRLAIARALLIDSKLVLMDEPSRSLDPGAASKLYSLIREKLLSPSRALVFSTHDFREAEKLATHAMILSHGKLQYSGPCPDSASLQQLYSRHTEALT